MWLPQLDWGDQHRGLVSLSLPSFVSNRISLGASAEGRKEPALAPSGMMSSLRTCSSHWARCWSLSRPHCHSLPACLSLPLSLTMNPSLPTSVSSVVSFTHTHAVQTHTRTHTPWKTETKTEAEKRYETHTGPSHREEELQPVVPEEGTAASGKGGKGSSRSSRQ